MFALFSNLWDWKDKNTLEVAKKDHSSHLNGEELEEQLNCLMRQFTLAGVCMLWDYQRCVELLELKKSKNRLASFSPEEL